MDKIRVALPPVEKGRLIVRPNRFLAQVEVNGQEVSAHVADPGRLKELLYPGAEVYVSAADSQNRKTAYDLRLASSPTGLVSMDSRVPNMLAAKALSASAWPKFAFYEQVKSEPRYKNSRFDFLLRGKNSPDCFIEVKGCTLVENKEALFPDAPTVRGTRQLGQLAELAEAGFRVAVIFIIQRQDAIYFRAHPDLDPSFSAALQRVYGAGATVLAFRCSVTTTEIALDSQVPVCF